MADDVKDSSTPNYTAGYSNEFLQLLERRNAAANAAYLLPYLKPGLRVLDFGCGPGSISVGLAKAVEPGELHGIDMAESQIDMARGAAVAGGHVNATFHVGDVTNLPFDDDSFDVAHCNAVLNHIPDTQSVLTEVKRVLKPGGIIASREAITSSFFTEPNIGNLMGLVSVWNDLMALNGGHKLGKELKSVFHEAGFTEIQASASFECFSTAPDIEFYHRFITNYAFGPSTIESATSHGLATRQQFDEWKNALNEWKDDPGAFATFAWGEAIGRKP